MYYDLDALEELSRELKFVFSRISSDSLEISIFSDAILVFKNVRSDKDALFGFKETQWHDHGKMILMLDEASYIELDELEVLQGIKDGEILILERHINDNLNDRWLAHRSEKIDVQYIQPGEKMQIRRLA